LSGFEFKESALKGAFLITPFNVSDERGEFIKDYNMEVFSKNGIEYKLKETFYTLSKRGVIRAIHFQLFKQQAKLIRCIKGRIYDVIVDLRPDSVTFGKWEGYYLTENNRTELLVPEFFGHGYLVLEDSIVSYKCNAGFYDKGDTGIMYNDSDINIDWPFDAIGGINNIIISEKDRRLMSFSEYKEKIQTEK